MTKALLTLLLMLSSALLFAQTQISGGIYVNTSWIPQGNPYILTGNVVLFEGLVLTIHPGVIVRFNEGAGLELRGKLVAIGTATDSIEFTSNLSVPVRNSWEGITVIGVTDPTGIGDQVTMDYCIGRYAKYFIDLDRAYHGPYHFKHCLFENNFQINNDGGLPITLFEHCKFVRNHQAVGHCQFQSIVTNCTFIDNEIGVAGIDLVDSCFFSGHLQYALGGNGVISNCTIVDNNVGVQCGFNGSSDTFIDNVVTGNNTGLKIETYFNGTVNFTGNTICENTHYNIELLHFNNADLAFNCWCSDDSAYIRSTILDGYTDTQYGLVNYYPISDDCPEVQVGIDSEVTRNISDVSIYPNPFTTELNVELNSTMEGEICIYSFDGTRLIQERVTVFRQLDAAHLPSGVFIYMVKANDILLKTGRLVKVE